MRWDVTFAVFLALAGLVCCQRRLGKEMDIRTDRSRDINLIYSGILLLK